MAKKTLKEEYTQAPWKLSGIAPLNICAADGTLIGDCCSGWQGSENIREANARRIVACINACEGIPTKDLESGEARQVRDELADIDALERQCENLSRALERIVTMDYSDIQDYDPIGSIVPKIMKTAMKALDKYKDFKYGKY